MNDFISQVHIRPGKESDLEEYTLLLQRTYEEAYTDESIGLTKERLSLDIFQNAGTQEYLKSKLFPRENQKTWLAEIDSKLVGALTIEDKGEECELTAFYVAPEHQGKGVGKKLWQQALQYSKGKDVVLDLFAHNKKAVEMYKKWGFEIDTSKGDSGVFYRHWEEWPKDFQVKEYYMRRKSSSLR